MAEAGSDNPPKARASDRRSGDRRVAQQPFDGSDRRSSPRRSGRDRRDESRTRLIP